MAQMINCIVAFLLLLSVNEIIFVAFINADGKVEKNKSFVDFLKQQMKWGQMYFSEVMDKSG